MAQDNDANRQIIELQMLDQQLRQMEEQARMIEQQIYEHESMILSLESIKGEKNSDIMVPLGPGLFVQGKIDNTDKVFIHVGNKIIADKTVDEAIGIIEKRRDKTMVAGDKISTGMQNVLVKMTSLESKVNAGQKRPHDHSCDCGEEHCDEDCEDCSEHK